MQKNTTICFSNSCKVWGGGEQWQLSTAMKLSEKGYNIVTITHKDSPLSIKMKAEAFINLSLPIHNLSFLNPFKIYRIKQFLRSNQVHVIILGLPSDVKLSGIAARLAGVQKIIYRRGVALKIRNSLLNRYLIQYILTHIIANSHGTRQAILENNKGLVHENQVSVIFNGIDTRQLQHESITPLYRKKEGEIVLGNAGRLSQEKGQHYLIDVALILKKRGLSFTMLLAGEGPEENKLKQRVKDLGMESNIRFPGFVDNIKSFMKSLDIFLLSSKWEGFGYVIAEALFHEVPVIGFDISSVHDMIINDRSGYLVEPFDIKQFAEKIMTLSKDEKKRKDMGNYGKKLVEDNFSIDKSIKKLENLFEK